MLTGFIGLGNMGRPVARNLIRLGYTVKLFDLYQPSVDKTMEAGNTGVPVKDVREMADCDLVFTCLPMPDDVKNMMMGDGLYGVMKKGAVHIDLSTIGASATRELEQDAGRHGLHFIQCTQGKSPAHAERAEQTLYVGGEKEVVDRLWDEIFMRIAQPVRVVSAEAASAIKLISNMMSGVICLAIAESIRLGEAAGMDARDVVELCRSTGCNSFHLETNGPFMAAKDFHTRFAVDLERKDMRLACEMARDKGLDLVISEKVLAIFNLAHEEGIGQEDVTAIYKMVGRDPG